MKTLIFSLFLSLLAQTNLATLPSKGTPIAATTDGLVAYYSLDGNTNDSQGSNNGTASGGPTYATGRIGQAMSFDGTNSVSLPTTGSLNITGALTISAWVRASVTPTWYEAIVRKGNVNGGAGSGQYTLGTLSNGRFILYLSNGTSIFMTIANTVPQAGTWYHVVGVYDGIGTGQIYVNGSLENSATSLNFGALNSAGSSRGASIGGDPGTSSMWSGLVDDVRVYNRALSSQEISEIYSFNGENISIPPPSSDTTAPSVPSNLSATASSQSVVNLSWTASTDAVGVTGYRVFRNGTQIATPSTNSYSNTGLSASTQYSYTVSAVDAAGNVSAQSSSANATTQTGTSDTTTPSGTTFYVRDGGTSSTCTDWTNACDALPATLVRGATYFVADGSYGGYIFDDPESGTQWITIKKATTADHGTNTGWLSSYGDGQAVFTGSFIFSRDYYEINGQKRNESNWADEASYGFRIMDSIMSWPLNFPPGGDHLTFKYINIGLPYTTSWSDTLIGTYPNFYLIAGQGNGQSSISDFYIGYSYLHNKLVDIHAINAHNGTVEYNQLGPSWGKESIRGASSMNGWTIRYNHFRDTCQLNPREAGTACTAEIGIWDGTSFDNNKFYGNIFQKTTNEANSMGSIIIGGSTAYGLVGALANNTEVYNNTIVGLKTYSSNILVNGGSGGTNNFVRNNIWSDVSSNTALYGAKPNTSNNIVVPTSAFVNYPTNLHLNAPTQAGTALVSDGFFNRDLGGLTRGSDGVWDLGAYEYVGSVTPPPPVVTNNLHINNSCQNNGDGSSWACASVAGGAGAFNNMLADISCVYNGYTWQRGKTYWIAGSDTQYGTTCLRNQSGTGRITIKKATLNDHGSNVGWNSTYASKQAVLGIMSVMLSDVTIDGSYRSAAESGYGIKVQGPGQNEIIATANNVMTTGMILKYLELTHTSYNNQSGEAIYLMGNGRNVISHVYVHDISGVCFKGNIDPAYNTDGGLSNSVIEESVCGAVGKTTGTDHTELMKDDGASHDLIIKNNLFYDWTSTGGIVMSSEQKNWSIFNNIFTQRTPGLSCGNGVITGLSAGFGWTGIKVFNNTFTNISSLCGYVFTGGFGDFSGAGNEVRNNLFYKIDTRPSTCTAGCIKSNNWYSEVPNYVPSVNEIVGNGNPFVNLSAGNYSLISGSGAIDRGMDLGSLYNIDKSNTSRPQGTSWDIGAYEYYSGQQPENPPTTSSSGGGGTSGGGTTPTTNTNTNTTTNTQTSGGGGADITQTINTTTQPRTGTLIPTVSQPNTTTTSIGKFTFTRTLRLKSIGSDVRQLQIFLNQKGFTIAKRGLGSKGYETTKFGVATRSALIKFQRFYKLPRTGVLDLKTRNKINTLK